MNSDESKCHNLDCSSFTVLFDFFYYFVFNNNQHWVCLLCLLIAMHLIIENALFATYQQIINV